MATKFDQFVEKVTKLPAPHKAGILLFIAAALTAGTFFLLVQPTWEQAEKSIRRMRALEDELIQNQAIANNLQQYRKEKELLEQQLAKALTELPEEANIDALVESLYAIGTDSGLVIVNIEPKGERRQDFYAEVPLAMTVTGNYHQIAVFFDQISKLKRIINVTGIKLTDPKVANEKVQLKATYTATAFRFLPKPPPGAPGKAPAKKKK